MQVLEFNNQLANSVIISGGKGANLAQLSQNDFPIPEGFIITSYAYREFIVQADLDLNFDYDDLDKLEKQCENLRQTVKNIAMPENIVRQIEEKLGQFDENQAFSVRSSSTLEDLGNSAFAGAHDTFLNCQGKDEIISKIKECFASLWQPRAVLYRNSQGFRQENADMAVVVQKMVFAEKAGVSFAINPVSGNFNELVINANYGLGESVVCGEYDVDEYHISKNNLEVIEQTIAEKKIAIVKDAISTKEVEIEQNLQNKACLSEYELKQIAELNIKTSLYFAFPQDIEWAIFDGRVYLLQSRPITTILPNWTRDESAERYPNPITPLTWDYVDKAFHTSLKYSFELMNLPHFTGKWFAMFDNYIYGDQNAVNLYMQAPKMAINSLQDIEKLLPKLQEKFAYALDLPSKWQVNLNQYLLNLGALNNENLEEKAIAELYQFMERIFIIGEEYFKPNIAISITQFMLYKLLMGFLEIIDKDNAASNFDILTTTPTKTILVNKEMRNLSLIVEKNQQLREMLLTKNSQEIIASNLLEKYPEFKLKFDKFIQAHGHREVEFDAYIPCWNEAPWIVLDNIRAILNNLDKEGQKNNSQSAKNRTELMVEIISKLDKKMQSFVWEFLELVRTYTILDDEEHYQTTRLTPIMRKVIFELGKRLKNKQVVIDEWDLFFAKIETIKAAVYADKYDELKREIIKNKAEYDKNSKITPTWNLNEEQVSIQLNNSNLLKGRAASAGIAEGEVFLVHSSADFALFPKQAILVAKTTNPAWTPLFYSARALITESGGVLSHGAVTAREMKIPAVMAVANVMGVLKNGQRVKVNGNNGEIEIL